MSRTKEPTKAETPVELLARRKRVLEGSIADVDRQLRAGERRRDRLTVQREAFLEELRGVDEAIERLGGIKTPDLSSGGKR